MSNPNVKMKYNLGVFPLLGTKLPDELTKLDGGVLNIFGQSGGLNLGTLNILSIELQSKNGDFRRAAAGVIDNMKIEFIYFPNGEEGGSQFTFGTGRPKLNSISGGKITRPKAVGRKKRDAEEEVGTWSGTGGISPIDHKKHPKQDPKKDPKKALKKDPKKAPKKVSKKRIAKT